MKLGMSAMCFEIEDAIEFCRDLKLNHIEIGIDDLSDWQYLKEQKNKLCNISIGIHLPMELNSCEYTQYMNDKYQEFFLKHYEIAKDFNVQYFNMHMGYGMQNKLKRNREKYLNLSLYFFYNILKNVHDINIYIENTYSKGGDFENIGTIVDDFNYIFNKIKNNNFGFCYDTGHDLLNKSNYLEDIDNIGLLHLSDNNKLDDLHMGISDDGNIDLLSIKNIIKSKNIKYCILEVKKEYLIDSKKVLDNLLV